MLSGQYAVFEAAGCGSLSVLLLLNMERLGNWKDCLNQGETRFTTKVMSGLIILSTSAVGLQIFISGCKKGIAIMRLHKFAKTRIICAVYVDLHQNKSSLSYGSNIMSFESKRDAYSENFVICLLSKEVSSPNKVSVISSNLGNVKIDY